MIEVVFLDRNIWQVTPKIIYFHYLKKIFSGSEYPTIKKRTVHEVRRFLGFMNYFNRFCLVLKKGALTDTVAKAFIHWLQAIIDPSEPNYCSCQQPSWGSMVGCESDTCLYEWFHYPCVGLFEPPQSKKWYCPTCRIPQEAKPNKRGRHKQNLLLAQIQGWTF